MTGEVSLFGHPSVRAEMMVLPRSAAWRGSRAALFWGGGLVSAPLVGLVPPHAPWLLGALGIGVYLGIRKWRERFTLVRFQGACPRCGGPLRMKVPVPVRRIHSVPCDGCHHDVRLSVAVPS
jgi:hypothetical protein